MENFNDWKISIIGKFQWKIKRNFNGKSKEISMKISIMKFNNENFNNENFNKEFQ